MGRRLEDGTWKDSCLDKVKPGEPIFVLRAQDALAPKIVREWAIAALRADVDPYKINEALDCADEMEKWPERRIPT